MSNKHEGPWLVLSGPSAELLADSLKSISPSRPTIPFKILSISSMENMLGDWENILVLIKSVETNGDRWVILGQEQKTERNSGRNLKIVYSSSRIRGYLEVLED